ncbi:hypothetical protein BZA05DRAFT_400075 [Tricharina praecox]|uniref:uncharacterized protein n=1 Tax=Tricharina praecox TaxID=43433 RepID=UPI0022200755|nr:uncharacterized protein BZA05DRAFT_400075 [Tricharina praecox]KAI5850720.1 hypothetical protein BZA05DRAFT_400075 [Tricharina praecox]
MSFCVCVAGWVFVAAAAERAGSGRGRGYLFFCSFFFLMCFTLLYHGVLLSDFAIMFVLFQLSSFTSCGFHVSSSSSFFFFVCFGRYFCCLGNWERERWIVFPRWNLELNLELGT